jgi:hypothetical protein
MIFPYPPNLPSLFPVSSRNNHVENILIMTPQISCDPMALTTPLPHHDAARHRRHSIGDSRPSLRRSSCPSPKR